MLPFYRINSFLIVMILITGNAFAGVSDYERDKMDKAIHNAKLVVSADVFDGVHFAQNIDKKTANRILNDYINALNSAVKVWNSLTSTAQSSLEGGDFLAKIQKKQTLSDQMRTAYSSVPDTVQQASSPTATSQTNRQSKLTDYQKEQLAREEATRHVKQSMQDKQNQQVADERERINAKLAQQKQDKTQKIAQMPVCKDFSNRAMKSQYQELMTLLIGQQKGDNSSLISVDQVNKVTNISNEVNSICNQIDYELLTSRKCYYANSDAYDPALWCEAAKNSKNLISIMALNGAKSMVKAVGFSLTQTPQQFMDNKGFLTFEGPVSFEEQLTFSDSKFTAQRQHTREILSAAGVNDDSQVWAEQKDNIDQLRQTVEKTASQWQNPINKGTDYSGKLASKQIKQMHKDTHIKDVWLTRATWKIHKNSLGVPLRRTKPGYILFKRDSEKYCQLKSYTLTEQYIGGGKYQTAGGVRFGYVRFQICD